MSREAASAGSPPSRAGATQRPRSTFARDFLALWLTLVAPLVAFARYHEYGLLQPELVVLYTALAGVALLGGLAIVAAGAWARVVALAAAVTLLLDLQFDFGRALVAIGLGVLAGSWLLRRHLSRILVSAMICVIASTLVLPVGSAHRPPVRKPVAPASGTDLPVIVHLILDEHIGLEGMPIEINSSREVKQSLIDFYLGHGFQLFGGAYSRYMNSYNAIPNLFNFTALTMDGYYADPKEQPLIIGENAWLQALADRGARIHIYQSDYMELCAVAGIELAACITRSIRTMKVLEGASMPLAGKVWVISSMHIGRAAAYRHFRRLYGRVQKVFRLPDWTWERQVIGALGADGLLGVLIDDVAAAQPGDVFIAHVMLPHFPYMLDRECGLRPSVADWLDRNDPALRGGGSEENSAAAREERYLLYLDQVECTRRRVGELLAAMNGTGFLEDAVVLIHGDHGSRIGRTKANAAGRERLTAADYSDYFSTLFAVRGPNRDADYDVEPRALDSLFLDVVRELGIPAADPATPPGVLLDDVPLGPMSQGPVP